MKTLTLSTVIHDTTLPLQEDLLLRAILQIEDVTDLKVALYLLMLNADKSKPAHFTAQMLCTDEQLMQLVVRHGNSLPPVIQLQDVLRRILAHDILLAVTVSNDILYFLNTALSRTLVREILETGKLPEGVVQENSTMLPKVVGISRPNIFTLYEQNIGLLTPLLADELRHAEITYPPEWVESAFREAILQNKRNWKYVRAILQRWQQEGKQTWSM